LLLKANFPALVHRDHGNIIVTEIIRMYTSRNNQAENYLTVAQVTTM